MRFTSPYVDKEINIPDDKVPDADRFSLKCPFTGKKIVVDRDGDQVRVSAAEPIADPHPPGPGETDQPREQLPSVEPDVIPPGAKAAFVFTADPAWGEAAKKFAGENGYHLSSADDALTAVAKLRLNNYDLIVVEDGEAGKRLVDEINAWPGLKRRSANFVLIGGDAKSMQPAIAFEKGVNAYFNRADGGDAQRLFKEALEGYDLYYRPLIEAEKKVHGLME